jgi:hypothetical protein
VKVKRRDRAYYQGVVFENPSVQETAADGFTPDKLLLHRDRRQAMGATASSTSSSDAKPSH